MTTHREHLDVISDGVDSIENSLVELEILYACGHSGGAETAAALTTFINALGEMTSRAQSLLDQLKGSPS